MIGAGPTIDNILAVSGVVVDDLWHFSSWQHFDGQQGSNGLQKWREVERCGRKSGFVRKSLGVMFKINAWSSERFK